MRRRLILMNDLYNLIKDYRTVSFIGLCKNAGKTTAMNQLLTGLQTDGIAVGVTSVGRDGESTDIVTGTAKPRIYVTEGTVFATAAVLFQYCDCTREILEVTDVRTPLGEVAVVRALSDGWVQLGGPSTVQQLIGLKESFARYGAERIIIDGATSRKSTCTSDLVDATVLSTGASLNRDMRFVVEQTAFSAEVLQLPVSGNPAASRTAKFCAERGMVMIGKEEIGVEAGVTPEIALRQYADNKTEVLLVDGALTDAFLAGFLSAGSDCANIEFVIRDAGKVLISSVTYNKLKLRQCRLRVLRPVRLAAVTVNPYSTLGVDFDAAAFQQAVAEQVAVPVINVLEANA